VGAIEGRDGVKDARDPLYAEALYSLLMQCTNGEEALWPPFERAIAQTKSIPIALDLASKIYVDPARANAPALEALELAIAALADEADLLHIIRIGMSATYVDRLEGCRDALWRVVFDARRGGAVALGSVALLELAFDDTESGNWDEAEELADEAVQICE